MKTIRPLRYIEELDAFVVTEEFAALAERLGLVEWHHLVWMGRLCLMDNDLGEHIFDNWSEREERADKARELGYDDSDLMIVAPFRFQDGRDGPCHSDEIRKAFWTDVFKSLELSCDLLFQVARQAKADAERAARELAEQGIAGSDLDGVEDLEEQIAAISSEINGRATVED